MSRYIYTFVKGDKEIEVEGYNLWNGAKNANLTIVRADALGSHYLQSTPFNERIRNVWCACEFGGTTMWEVKQRINN